MLLVAKERVVLLVRSGVESWGFSMECPFGDDMESGETCHGLEECLVEEFA